MKTCRTFQTPAHKAACLGKEKSRRLVCLSSPLLLAGDGSPGTDSFQSITLCPDGDFTTYFFLKLLMFVASMPDIVLKVSHYIL